MKARDQELALAEAVQFPKRLLSSALIHCPYRQASLLQEALTPNKMRIAFLIGAGCPTSIRIKGKDEASSLPLIPDIAGLTKSVHRMIEANESRKAVFETILERIQDLAKSKDQTFKKSASQVGERSASASGQAIPQAALEINVEQILSYLRALREVVGSTSHDGLGAAVLDDLEAGICAAITEVVEAQLPDSETPYHQLATWINSIRRDHSVEIFTPNYDLLIERALESRKVPYFDGFVGSDRTFFDQVSIETDSLPVRWARLWKIHGSINWWRTSDGSIERRRTISKGESGKERQMIYPSHLKYDQSRRLPYLTMLDRLRSFLGDGQAVLVTCGYSFSDQHLNEVILRGLNANPTAICFGLLYGDREKYPEALGEARKCANLNLLAVDGAVLGTVERDWHCNEKPEHPMHGIGVSAGSFGDRTKSGDERCKFLLGDFAALGGFLARQGLAIRNDGRDGSNGT